MKAAIITVVLALAAGAAVADVITLPLNGSAGLYDINTPAWSYNFDLGVTFSEISHVYIDWSGEATANLISYPIGTPPRPMGATVRSVIYLGPYPQHAEAIVGGGMSSYPAPELFNVQSEYQLFESTWADLLDGQGHIRMGYYLPIMSADIAFIEYGSVTLNNATLVVDGTITPEPTSIMLLLLGTGLTVRMRHFNSYKQVTNLN